MCSGNSGISSRSVASVHLAGPSYGPPSKSAGPFASSFREGSPAEKGGLKGGDIIIRLGDKKVGTIYDFMETLGAHKPGEEVDVMVKRDGKEVKLRVTMGSRSGR